MKHLRVAQTRAEIADINKRNAARKRSTRVVLSPAMKKGGTACTAPLADGDELVDAALEADCDACRVAVGVAKKGDKTWEGKAPIGVNEVKKWEAQPMADAETLIASAMKNRS